MITTETWTVGEPAPDRAADFPCCVRDQNGWVVAYPCGFDAGSIERRAALIAAAPDLLRTLEALIEWCRDSTSPQDDKSPHQLMIAAVGAIAKAKGQPHPDALAEIGRPALIDVIRAEIAPLTKACDAMSRNHMAEAHRLLGSIGRLEAALAKAEGRS